jgi:hypothetical protein
MMLAAIWSAVIAAALFALHRLAVWAESKGWIYYRTKRRGSATSAVLSGFDVVANPGAEYVTQAKQQKKLEERDNGDPPSIVS